MEKRCMAILVFVMVISAIAGAVNMNAQILLPDGSGAPFATVEIDGKIFTATESGEIEISYDAEENATVRWLDLEQSMPISGKMKFSNRLYYGAPYDKTDFIIQGADEWEITKTNVKFPGGADNESQIFLDDSFDDFIFRSKFISGTDAEWHYLRFMFRAAEPGFNGYALNFAFCPWERNFFVRYDGSFDKYAEITEDRFVSPSLKPKVQNEFVAFIKDERIVCYVRSEGEAEYKKIVDAIDDSDEAFYFGSIGILSSFVPAEITEISVFRY